MKKMIAMLLAIAIGSFCTVGIGCTPEEKKPDAKPAAGEGEKAKDPATPSEGEKPE